MFAGTTANPTVSDFIAHRWADAKAELAKLDPEFVSALESEARLDRLGLVPPRPSLMGSKPKARLPGKWHELLEACMELELQADCLETAARLLLPSGRRGNSADLSGKEAIYHFWSLFIHTVALAERVEAVIDRTAKLFATRNAKALVRRFKSRVHTEVKQRVERQRHDYLHGPRKSWASGITEDELWEASVAADQLPRMILEQQLYPGEDTKVQGGKRSVFATSTRKVLARLGRILRDLEVELGLATAPAQEGTTDQKNPRRPAAPPSP